jgi:hypothetical protein
MNLTEDFEIRSVYLFRFVFDISKMNCGVCGEDIGVNFIKCVECKKCYHPTCTRVETVENFKKMNSSRKDKWKCDLCFRQSINGLEQVNKNISIILGSLAGLKTEVKSMSERLDSKFSELKSNIETINDSLVNLQVSCNTLKSENDSFREKLTELEAKNVTLESTVKGLNLKLDALEQYTRGDNLIVLGLPFTANENILAVVENIAKAIGVTFNANAISTAHRLPSRRAAHPPIVVRFSSRIVKYEWLKCAKIKKHLYSKDVHPSLTESRIFINEHLSPFSASLLSGARRLLAERKIQHAWTRDGRVLVRQTGDGPVIWIRAVEDLAKFNLN